MNSWTAGNELLHDSATGGEIGQARSRLNLTGNTSALKDNEFHFVTIKGQDDPARVIAAIDALSKSDGVPPAKARKVAERVESLMLEPKGLVTLSEAYKAFYAELRSPESTALKAIVASKLHRLGAKPKGLHLTIEEFVTEDFRIHSNLTSRFGLSSENASENAFEIPPRTPVCVKSDRTYARVHLHSRDGGG